MQMNTLNDVTDCTYETEAALTRAYGDGRGPLVLDGGSVFAQDAGGGGRGGGHTSRHSNACGWLAIHAALHYADYLDRLPERLRVQLRAGMLGPAQLKLISGGGSPLSLDAKIEPDGAENYTGYTRICAHLGICIVLHYSSTDGQGDPIYTARAFRPEYRPNLTIELWQARGHICAFYPDRTQRRGLRRFARQFSSFNYTTGAWRPGRAQSDLQQSDYALARALHYALNGSMAPQ